MKRERQVAGKIIAETIGKTIRAWRTVQFDKPGKSAAALLPERVGRQLRVSNPVIPGRDDRNTCEIGIKRTLWL
jgi:hypothetical protein